MSALRVAFSGWHQGTGALMRTKLIELLLRLVKLPCLDTDASTTLYHPIACDQSLDSVNPSAVAVAARSAEAGSGQGERQGGKPPHREHWILDSARSDRQPARDLGPPRRAQPQKRRPQHQAAPADGPEAGCPAGLRAASNRQACLPAPRGRSTPGCDAVLQVRLLPHSTERTSADHSNKIGKLGYLSWKKSDVLHLNGAR